MRGARGPWTALCAGGLVVAAVGVTAQYLAAPEDFPALPPGPFLLAADAVVVARGGRWRASPLVGVALALVVLVGGWVGGGIVDNLTGPVGAVVGATVMLVGLVTAVVAGVVACVRPPAARP